MLSEARKALKSRLKESMKCLTKVAFLSLFLMSQSLNANFNDSWQVDTSCDAPWEFEDFDESEFEEIDDADGLFNDVKYITLAASDGDIARKGTIPGYCSIQSYRDAGHHIFTKKFKKTMTEGSGSGGKNRNFSFNVPAHTNIIGVDIGTITTKGPGSAKTYRVYVIGVKHPYIYDLYVPKTLLCGARLEPGDWRADVKIIWYVKVYYTHDSSFCIPPSIAVSGQPCK